MGELLKHLPTIMKYAKYLKYLVIVPPLIEFIREAERRYREAGNGRQKLAWVSEQFAALVMLFETSGAIPAKLAEALRAGAEAIISVIVQIINAAGGFDNDLPPQT